MPEQLPPQEFLMDPPPQPRQLKTVDEIRGDVRTIRNESAHHREFSPSALYWTAQVGKLTESLLRGEIAQKEFDGLIGTIIAEKETAAEIDQLTGIHRRDAFMKRSYELLSLLRRTDQVASVAFIDLDGFKQINDSYGHDAGDAVLQQVAGFLQSEIREHDELGRLGGEEIGMMLPSTDEEGAHTLLERLGEALPDAVEEALTGMGFAITERITMSVGIAPIQFAGNPKEKLSETVLQSALSEADKRMYQAKKLGKNRVISAKNLPPQEG